MIIMRPCVGFGLQYSPIERACVDNLAQSLHNLTREYIFDVVQAVMPGQEIQVVFSNNQTPTHCLTAEVRECNQIGENHYRISLMTQAEAVVRMDNTESIYMPIAKGTATALQMTLECPSCNHKSSFQFIANQEGDWEKGMLPIYNCGSCGSSRAMIGLVSGKD